MNNIIDFSNITNQIVAGVAAGIFLLIARHFYTQWKEGRQRKFPVLEKLNRLLENIKEEVNVFAGKGTTKILRENTITYSGTYTSGDIVIHNGDEVFLNVNSCGGPLSWKGILEDPDSLIPKIKVFLKEFPPHVKLDREKGKLIDIKNSLENFVCRLKEFNKRCPSFPPGPSIAQLKQKGVNPFEEALKIESMADSIKKDVIELKSKVDKVMRPGWF